eukprot:symbB.v1.2.003229.t1/scaffold181.1/size282934/10
MPIHRLVPTNTEEEMSLEGELRRRDSELLRCQAQLQQREITCMNLLSENVQLKSLKSRLFAALERVNIDPAEFLKDDERKIRMEKVDKQLEAELREMHAVVSDQQKRLDALTLENERLRQELHDRHQVSEVPQSARSASSKMVEVFSESFASPPPPELATNVAKPRPWPLRSSVAPTHQANKGPPLRLLVRLMPRALRRNGGAVEKLEVSLSLSEPAKEVMKLLQNAQLSWSSAGMTEELTMGQLQLNGKVLTMDQSLEDQGVVGTLLTTLSIQPSANHNEAEAEAIRCQEDSELRLVKRPKVVGQFQSQGVFAPRLPRGILMNAEPWAPRSSRKAAVDFFDQVNDADMDHMAKILLKKRGQTEPHYKH